jgi:hypothetical protein
MFLSKFLNKLFMSVSIKPFCPVFESESVDAIAFAPNESVFAMAGY